MKLARDSCILAAAAIAVAITGCETKAPDEGNTGSDSLSGSPDTPNSNDIPAHCVPIDGTPPMVLLHGRVSTAQTLAHKPQGPKSPGAGGVTIPVPAVQLGAPALKPGMGPGTADVCEPATAKLPGTPGSPTVVRECFFGAGDTTPAATIERVLESVDDIALVHVRLTFNPHFVDNSYGSTAMGWANSKNGTHTFKDLVGSDHAELLFTNRAGAVALHAKLDYLSLDSRQPSGYGTLGVLGGEGAVLVGNPSHVIQVATSLDRDLNGCGYGGYLESTPATDTDYTPNSTAPNWDFRVVYELWIAAEAFGSSGFGGVNVEYVHASPSKLGQNTLIVDPKPCPPDEPPGGTCKPGDTNCPPPSCTPGDANCPPPSCTPGDANCPPPSCTPGDANCPPPPSTECPPGTVPRDPPPPPSTPDAGTPSNPPDAGTRSCEAGVACRPTLL